MFTQATGANSNAKMAVREVPLDESQRAAQWIGVRRAGRKRLHSGASWRVRRRGPQAVGLFQVFFRYKITEHLRSMVHLGYIIAV